MTRLYTAFIILILLFPALTTEAAKPKWVKKRPSQRDYYLGIGMAYKTKDSGLDYAKKARADALKELASEIEVNVSSNSLLRQFENNFDFGETFESEISTSAEENLVGYEVNTWENKREYWVFLRLNKDQYMHRKRQDLEMAKRIAASYLFDARKQAKEIEITAALASYFKAIESLQHHLKDDLTYKSIDGNINFGTDIMQDLRGLFFQISITPLNPDYQVAFSKTAESPLRAKVEYYTPEGRKVPVPNFPVRFEFTDGKGILQESVTSNPGGEVSSYIQKFESSRKKQRVSASFDPTILLQKENIESPLVNFFLPGKNIPRAFFNIELQKSDAWFSANEQIFGSTTTRQPFANQLKSHLNETFFNFSHSPENASYIVEIQTEFRKGDIKEGTGYSVYLVFADLYISISSATTKTEIFSGSLTGIKGMQPGNYNYALKEACQQLLDRFREEIYPQLEILNF